MSLVLPAVGAWSVDDLEKLDTGDLVANTGGPVYRLERKVRLSTLEQEDPGAGTGRVAG